MRMKKRRCMARIPSENARRGHFSAYPYVDRHAYTHAYAHAYTNARMHSYAHA